MDDLTDVREGNSDYLRPSMASQVKNLLSRDQELAKQIYAWLRCQGIKLTDY